MTSNTCVEIKKRIFLPPKCLDSNITKHILKYLKLKTRNKCTKDYGYILSIKNIISIESIESTIFNVIFKAKTLKPVVGAIFDGIVCKVYKDGLFIDIMNTQKMLIPSSLMNDYIYNEEDNLYYKENKKICKDTKVKAIVTAVQYNKQKFSCFGELKE